VRHASTALRSLVAVIGLAAATDRASAQDLDEGSQSRDSSTAPVTFTRLGIEIQARGGAALPDGIAYDNGSLFGLGVSVALRFPRSRSTMAW